MRELVSAITISDARKAGMQHIYADPHALITPQAKDDAKTYGIAILMRDASTQNAVPKTLFQPTTHVPPQQNRVVMNNANTSTPNTDLVIQQLIEQVMKAVAPPQTAVQMPSTPCFAHAQNTALGTQAQAMNPAVITAQVVQQLNTLLAARGGIVAFPGLDATIAKLVAEYIPSCNVPSYATPSYTNAGSSPHIMAAPSLPTGQAISAPLPMNTPSSALAGVDVVPFLEQPTGRVQGEVNIEEALLPGQNGNGMGVTRFTFADTSLVWTFPQQEVLVVTHGTIEVQGSGGATMLMQGGAMRVAAGTSLTLVAHGLASCVCTTWFQS